jgi:hypothetical protein
VLRLLNAFEHAALPLDRLRGRDVVRRADDQYPLHAKVPCLVQNLLQRPSGKALPSSGRAYSIADVASAANLLGVAVPQRDTAENPAVLDDPPIPATRRLARLEGVGSTRLSA